MNIKYYLLVVLCVISSHLYGQKRQFSFDYKILYKMDYQPDSTSSDMRSMDMVLLTNDHLSLFESLNRYNRDSVMFNFEPEEYNKSSLVGALPLGLVNKMDYQILKSQNQITSYDIPFGSRGLDGKRQVYVYEEPVSTFKWDVLEEVSTIAGFECQKATTNYGGRIWTAYFTHEIPISDGPYKFCGLPGLIVQIEDETGGWSFSLSGIQKNKFPVSINFQKWYVFHEVDREKFLEERREFQNNLPTISKSLSSDFPEAAIALYMKKLKADNNWIELY